MKLKFDAITEDGRHFTVPGKNLRLSIEHLTTWLYEQNGVGSGLHKVEHLRPFTGRTDADGREIYDGDILETHMANGRRLTGVMQWVDSRSGWAEFLPRSSWRVIGNIHDNPELLESVA